MGYSIDLKSYVYYYSNKTPRPTTDSFKADTLEQLASDIANWLRDPGIDEVLKADPVLKDALVTFPINDQGTGDSFAHYISFGSGNRELMLMVVERLGKVSMSIRKNSNVQLKRAMVKRKRSLRQYDPRLRIKFASSVKKTNLPPKSKITYADRKIAKVLRDKNLKASSKPQTLGQFLKAKKATRLRDLKRREAGKVSKPLKRAIARRKATSKKKL